MDETIFDAATRRFSTEASRRGALRLFGGALIAGLIGGTGGRVADVAAYPSSCRRFILSGGKKRKKVIDVDDDLSVYLNGRRIFRDSDGVIGDGLDPLEPIKFRGRSGDKLRIVATDGEGPCRSLSSLWLHCKTGGDPVRLTRGVRETCKNDRPPRVFFDETFRI